MSYTASQLVASSLAFAGNNVTYGQIRKHYDVQAGVVEATRRYSSAELVAVSKLQIIGCPSHISTFYVERQNLTLRMQQRRFSRLSKSSKFMRRRSRFYVAHYSMKHCASPPPCT